MADNELTTYKTPEIELKPSRNNYIFSVGNEQFTLKRDVDFGKVPKAKSPSLWKAGAEKILLAFHLRYDVEITDSYKDFKDGFFYYECKATAYANGEVFRVGVGCANTNETSNGTAVCWNQANVALKKAKKRAIVDLALTLGALSDCFTQDIEDENFTNAQAASKLQSDEDYITSKQVQRIFAIASTKEISREKAKQLLVSWGVESTSKIKVKDYDAICEKFMNYEG